MTAAAITLLERELTDARRSCDESVAAIRNLETRLEAHRLAHAIRAGYVAELEDAVATLTDQESRP